VDITATLLGSSATGRLTLHQPAISSFVLTPASISAGQTSKAVVMIENTYAADITLNLVSDAPGFAAVPSPPTAIIHSGDVSTTFDVTTPPSNVPFPPAKADIQASYSGSTAVATLQVQSTVEAGTIDKLQLSPSSVTAGGTSTGIVTLLSAMKVDTVVGLAALEPGHGPLGNPSPIASVPPQITIKAGQTQGTFTITTVAISPQATQRTATIMAVAVVTKTTVLTLT
jgi:hypothetical protein